jgi:hypothetical protein
MNSRALVNSRNRRAPCKGEGKICWLSITSRRAEDRLSLTGLFTAGSPPLVSAGKHYEQRRRDPPLTPRRAQNDRDSESAR